MQAYQTIQYKLEATDAIAVVGSEDGTASLCCSAWSGAPQGFQIQFTPHHIESLEQLLTLLWAEVEAGRDRPRVGVASPSENRTVAAEPVEAA